MTPDLGIDSPAPSIKVQHWLRGDPLSNFQLGKIYIFDFFATTCGYCRSSLSYLAQLSVSGIVILPAHSAADVNGPPSPSISYWRIATRHVGNPTKSCA
ncbi:TlpA family protein disulfide reductase [Rhizobium leguminosarum]|uniref:Redoxin domain-containing protein n=1 Tax=Rhizobium leguminosarum TaxID=384 RepID=A0A2K9ZGY4_RHILE|nr:hypothetical protein [Rhizobium leguminosarum]AUW47516.1 hypothetical protein CUJ84_pRLN3000396 [Rhizobium leguminosarum]